MKLLLLGSSGQVGHELSLLLDEVGEIISPTRDQLDLIKTKSVDTYLQKIKPDLIINAAAWTNVDEAESNKNIANRLNADLPKQLSYYSEAHSIKLIHYSSDYVYQGDGSMPWSESSLTKPLNYYGKTKLKGDNNIQKSKAEYIIFRTSWVYSPYGSNFLKTMLKLGNQKSDLRIISDQIGSPTPAKLIAEITLNAISKNIAKGVYNLAPRGYTSWYEFAKTIFTITEKAGIKSKIDINKIYPIKTKDYPMNVLRPLNSRLNTEKLERALDMNMPDWKSQLTETINEYKKVIQKSS